MADFAVNIIVRARDQASSVVANVVRKIGKAADDDDRKRKNKAADLAAASGAITQIAGVAQKAWAPVDLAMNFEAAINKVNALSGGALGASGRIKDIEAEARRLGQTTEFTATQAAEGFQILTQAGFTTEQQMASIATVLDLATAAGITMDQAATLTANSIGGFGLKAEDAARIGDVMARASNASQISIAQLGDSFRYAAPGAKVLGVSLEETAAAVAVLGKAGRFGSQGGTDLRAFMNRLSMLSSEEFATKKQKTAAKMLGIDRESLQKVVASGDLQNIAKYLGETISKSGLSSTEVTAAMQAIFQERGATAGMILMASALNKGTGGWQEMENAVNDANITLGKSAEIIRSGTKGDITKLKSAMEELGITVGQKLLPHVTPLIKRATDAAVAFAKWANAHPTLVAWLGRAALGIAAVTTVVGPMLQTMISIKILTSFSGGLGAVATEAAAASKSMMLLKGTGGVLMAAVAGWTLGSIIDEFLGLSDAIAGVNQNVSIFKGNLGFDGLGFNTKQVPAFKGSLGADEQAERDAAQARVRELGTELENFTAFNAFDEMKKADMERQVLAEKAKIDAIDRRGQERSALQATMTPMNQAAARPAQLALATMMRLNQDMLSNAQAAIGLKGEVKIKLSVDDKGKITSQLVGANSDSDVVFTAPTGVTPEGI